MASIVCLTRLGDRAGCLQAERQRGKRCLCSVRLRGRRGSAGGTRDPALGTGRRCVPPLPVPAVRLPCPSPPSQEPLGIRRVPLRLGGRSTRSLLAARLAAETKQLTAYKLLEKIFFPPRFVFPLVFLCAVLRLTVLFSASLPRPH